MEIKINEQDLEAAINSKIQIAIGSALEGYGVRSAIEEKLTSDITYGLIGDALQNALEQMDTGNLTNVISIEIQRAMVSAVTHVIYEGLASILTDLRKIPSYDEKAREKARVEILAAIRREK